MSVVGMDASARIGIRFVLDGCRFILALEGCRWSEGGTLLNIKGDPPHA